MTPSKGRDWPVGWLIIGAILLFLFVRAQLTDAPPTPNYNGPVGNAPPYNPPTFDSGGTGYENPAPGDDGSSDCPPGGGPVYVGSSDPAGLDGDGDGIGCE